MGKGLLKWLASAGIGLASTVLIYATDLIRDPQAPIDGVDPLISFVVIGGLAKLVGWLTSLLPAAPKDTTVNSGTGGSFGR